MRPDQIEARKILTRITEHLQSVLDTTKEDKEILKEVRAAQELKGLLLTEGFTAPELKIDAKKIGS